MYTVGHYPNGDLRAANWVLLGHKTRSWKRARKLVYRLRRRGVLAFAEGVR